MMDYATVFTCVVAAAAVIAAYAVSMRILGNHFSSFLVVLPLALSIPWTKRFPAVGDALTLFAAMGMLYLWLSAQASPTKIRAAFVGMLAMVALKPETLILALAAVAYHVLRHGGPSWRRDIVRACTAAIAAAFVSSLIVNPSDVRTVVSGLLARLTNCIAWDGANWIFAGADINTSFRTAKSYGATFYVPLAVVFSALAWKYRGNWWFGPVFIWAGCILVQTARAVEPLVLRACPPLIAAFLVAFGSVGVLLLREECEFFVRFLGPDTRRSDRNA